MFNPIVFKVIRRDQPSVGLSSPIVALSAIDSNHAWHAFLTSVYYREYWPKYSQPRYFHIVIKRWPLCLGPNWWLSNRARVNNSNLHNDVAWHTSCCLLGFLLHVNSNPSTMTNAAVPANEKITASYDSVYLLVIRRGKLRLHTQNQSHIHLTSMIIQSCLLL